MQKIKNHTSGFGIVGILLIIAVLILLGLTAGLVIKNQRNSASAKMKTVAISNNPLVNVSVPDSWVVTSSSTGSFSTHEPLSSNGATNNSSAPVASSLNIDVMPYPKNSSLDQASGDWVKVNKNYVHVLSNKKITVDGVPGVLIKVKHTDSSSWPYTTHAFIIHGGKLYQADSSSDSQKLDATFDDIIESIRFNN